MKKKILIAVAVLAVLGAIAGAFYGGIKYLEYQNEKKKPTVDTIQLSAELSEISELATMEYNYTNTVSYDSHLDFYGYRIPFTTNFFIISYDGVIKAGVDLSKAQINLEGEVITVALPPAEILSHTVDYDSLTATDESYSIFNKITITDYASFTADQNAKMEEKALKAGLLDKARENAILVVKSFIVSMNPSFSVVVF